MSAVTHLVMTGLSKKVIEKARIICLNKKLSNENKDVDSSTSPLCKSVLLAGNQHIQQANFVAGLWKRSIISTPDIPTFFIHN